MKELGMGQVGGPSKVDPLPQVNVAQLPIDMQKLTEYEKKIEQIPMVNAYNGPLYMKDFLEAKDLAAQFLAQVMFAHEQARDKSKKAKSIARLDKSKEGLALKGQKPTDKAIEAYSEQDPDYLSARTTEAYYKSLEAFLKMKVDKFQSAHDDVKKIYDRTKEPAGSITGAPSTGGGVDG